MKKYLFMTVLASLLMTGCSEDAIVSNGENGTNNEGRFMAVEIVSPSANMSRATAPGAGDFEEGLTTPDENKVNSLRFYFFDATGGPIALKGQSGNYVDATEIKEEGKDMPNVEQRLEAVVVINPTNTANVASMIAVANYEDANLGTGSYSRENLAAVVGDYSKVAKTDGTAHFMMTSSTYADANGQVTRAFLKPENLCSSPDEAKEHAVQVYIERVVAKVRLGTEWRTTAEEDKVVMETKTVKYKDKEYTAIKAKDKDGNAIKNGEKDVYILFTGWDVTGKADKSFFIKKVNSTTKWTTLSDKWFWNHPDYHRSYWAVNPEGMKLTYNTYNSIQKEMSGAYTYCLENAADYANYETGKKNAYNPESTTSNRTQVILAAMLVTVDENSNATPISLAKWGYNDYTEEGVKATMLGVVQDQIYYETTPSNAPEGTSRTFERIAVKHVKLVPAEVAKKANQSTENSERYLSYLMLADDDKEAAKGVQFYTSAVATATTTDAINAAMMDHDAVNKILLSVPGAKVWHDGLTYYYTDIRHLNQTASDVEWGYYGVVRNHIYDIKLNSVTGLGTPVLDPGEVIIPQHPSDDKDIYVAAQINILSWRLVKNNVDLVW